MLYSYRANITSIHDGDTLTVDIDLGFGVWLREQKLRLYGINAPELSTAEGKNSRDAIVGLLGSNTAVDIETKKPEGEKEKYGRWLATIWVVSNGVTTNVNHWMVTNGYAKPFMV